MSSGEVRSGCERSSDVLSSQFGFFLFNFKAGVSVCVYAQSLTESQRLSPDKSLIDSFILSGLFFFSPKETRIKVALRYRHDQCEFYTIIIFLRLKYPPPRPQPQPTVFDKQFRLFLKTALQLQLSLLKIGCKCLRLVKGFDISLELLREKVCSFSVCFPSGLFSNGNLALIVLGPWASIYYPMPAVCQVLCGTPGMGRLRCGWWLPPAPLSSRKGS